MLTLGKSPWHDRMCAAGKSMGIFAGKKLCDSG